MCQTKVEASFSASGATGGTLDNGATSPAESAQALSSLVRGAIGLSDNLPIQ